MNEPTVKAQAAVEAQVKPKPPETPPVQADGTIVVPPDAEKGLAEFWRSLRETKP